MDKFKVIIRRDTDNIKWISNCSWEPGDISTWWNIMPLQWRHNESNAISNHRHLDCLFKPLFRRRSKKTPKLRVTGLCEGNIPVKGPVTRKCFHLMTSSCIYLFVTTVTGRPFWQTPGASIAIFSALSGWCHRKSQLSAGPRILRKKGNNLTCNVSWTCAEIYVALHKVIRTTLILNNQFNLNSMRINSGVLPLNHKIKTFASDCPCVRSHVTHTEHDIERDNPSQI